MCQTWTDLLEFYRLGYHHNPSQIILYDWRDSNPHLPPWKGGFLPLEDNRIYSLFITKIKKNTSSYSSYKY
jgi:hypothetical protein